METFSCYCVCYCVANDAFVGSNFVDENFVWDSIDLVYDWCYEWFVWEVMLL